MADRALVFIGNYTSGDDAAIYYGEADPASGGLRIHGRTPCEDSPSFLALHPNGRYLYAANEVSHFDGAGAVSAFAVDADSGALTFLNLQPTGGSAPCHNTVDHSGRFVLSANYGGGSVSMHPVRDDGSLGEISDFHQHEGSSVDPGRQQGPHAHSINVDPGNGFAFCADLGLDEVLVYALDLEAGRLVPHGAGRVTPGAGPRHMAFHPNRRFAYVINEISNTITVFARGEDGGSLTEVEEVTTLPAGYAETTHTSDIHLSSDGRFLYGSNRGHDSIAAFAVDSGSGRLTLLGHAPVPSAPRNFAIDPTGRWLYSGGHNTDRIAVLRVDDSGRLEDTGQGVDTPSPVCIKMLR